MSSKLILFLFFLTFANSLITNTNVERTINLKSNIIYIESEITVNNPYSERSYKYLVTKNNSFSLVNIKALGDKDINLSVKKVEENEEFVYFNIDLNGSSTFKVVENHFGKIKFLPRKISILEPQLEVFEDSGNLLSYYETIKQTTTLLLPSELTRVISFTGENGFRSENKITFSHKTKIPPLRSLPIFVHYENNYPLVRMNSAVKTFQVSHWGNIAVTEEYKLENVGAVLEGEFGRVDYLEGGRGGGKNALTSLTAILPLRSWGLWYRDEIGNVSTSSAIREWDDVKLILQPRFPILGGWKSNFDIGYNLPSKFHVTTNGQGNYVVNLTFGMPYKDMLASNYTVKTILPEGADNIKVDLPIDTEYTIRYDKEYGCLDLFGRKAVVINLKNMHDEFNSHLLISYDYNWCMLFVKPVILIVYFFIVFLLLIVYSRADISLSRTRTEKEKDKVL